MNWKLPVAAGLVALVVVAGVVSGGNVVDNFRSVLRERFGGIFSVPTENLTIPVNIDMSLSYFVFSGPSDGLRISIEPGAVFVVSGEKFTFSVQSNISIYDFRGTVKISSQNRTVEINGKAKQMEVNGISVLPELSELEITGTGFYNDIGFSGARMKKVELKGQGNITLWNRLKTDVLNEIVELSGFYGSIYVSKDFSFSGVTSRASVDGTVKFVAG
ncbi:MAG: hypothetical protein GXO63_02920 [Candidatus Micrarchaeota archaeon]|nr:hypothetical protein [Candidatus Micrarchaeota archaeon]